MSKLTNCRTCGESVSKNMAIRPNCGKPVILPPDTNSRRHVVLDRLTDAYQKGKLTDTNLRSLWEIAKQFMKDPIKKKSPRQKKGVLNRKFTAIPGTGYKYFFYKSHIVD